MLFYSADYHIGYIKTNSKARLQLDLGTCSIVDSNWFFIIRIHNSNVNF